jgi:hypothetical protein
MMDDVIKIIIAFFVAVFIAIIAYTFITSNIDMGLKIVIGIIAAICDAGILYQAFKDSD